jgi:hypothetical protein
VSFLQKLHGLPPPSTVPLNCFLSFFHCNPSLPRTQRYLPFPSRRHLPSLPGATSLPSLMSPLFSQLLPVSSARTMLRPSGPPALTSPGVTAPALTPLGPAHPRFRTCPPASPPNVQDLPELTSSTRPRPGVPRLARPSPWLLGRARRQPRWQSPMPVFSM